MFFTPISGPVIRPVSILTSQRKDASSGKAEIRAFDIIKPTSKQPVDESCEDKAAWTDRSDNSPNKEKVEIKGFLFRELSGLPRGHSETWLICQGQGE